MVGGLKKFFLRLSTKADSPLKYKKCLLAQFYNHSSFAVTRRYLGIAQDDKDEVYCRLAEVV
uniref:Integrase n=1 Tax=uncultured bacterium contig00017 TaxID=1181508 RepID=A0A806KAK5_9BACT|nr:hypothetical protein [uncultured bacterium contig00017]